MCGEAAGGEGVCGGRIRAGISLAKIAKIAKEEAGILKFGI
jgi:hypothetical protein